MVNEDSAAESLTTECSGEEPRVHRAAAEPVDEIAAVYEEHLSLMIGVAVTRFGIPRSDAETLAHEVFLDYILKRERVTSTRAWLVTSMYNASQYYLRTRARMETLPATYNESPDPHLLRVNDMWLDQLAARQAFGCTTARCQLALRLRFMEGYTVPEIAAELGTSNRYAAKLIGECLRQANRRYTKRDRGGSECGQ